MRLPNGIELYINKSKLTEDQYDYIESKYDVELYAEKNEFTLWLHPYEDNYKPFDIELFQFLTALKGVYNNRTKQDHLDLFIEVDEIDEFGVEIEGIKYKNIRASELTSVDLSKVKLKRELYNTIME